MLAAPVAGLLALVAGVAPAHAEAVLWTLLASPLTATTGTQTTFTLTATNEDVLEPLDSNREIGCVVVEVPANFSVAAATVSGSSTGGSWAAELSGDRVTVRAGSGGDRLELLDWVRFTVRATPLASGSPAWTSRAYRDQGCAGAGAALGVPPIVVVSGLPVTPSPLPTLAPTPTLPPLPTLTPLPTLPQLPTRPPPARPTVTPVPSATATSRPSADGPSDASDRTPSEPPAGTGAGSIPPSPGAEAAEDVLPPGSGTSGIGNPGALAEPALRIDPGLLLGPAGFAWVVPAAVVGVPGLLAIGWVAAQAVAALLWIPAVRRLRQERRGRHRAHVSGLGAPQRR
jgi:hypothetical protein